MEIVPGAEQSISYGLPAFKLRGKIIAGFAAFKNHLSYLPHSGSVLSQLANEIRAYTSTAGALHFPIAKPLPKPLVKKLLATRIEQALGSDPRARFQRQGEPGRRGHVADRLRAE